MEQEEKKGNLIENEDSNFDLFGQSFNEIQTDSIPNDNYVVDPSMESIADSISNIEINSNTTAVPELNSESTILDNNLEQENTGYSFEQQMNMENNGAEIVPEFNVPTPVDNSLNEQPLNYELEPQLNTENNLSDNNVINTEFNIYGNSVTQNQNEYNEYQQPEPMVDNTFMTQTVEPIQENNFVQNSDSQMPVENNDIYMPVEEVNLTNQNVKVNNQDMASDEEVKKFFKDFVIIAIIIIIVIIILPYVSELIGF